MGTLNLLDKIKLTPLKKISTPGGDVWHALKTSDETYQGFGEAYFSWVKSGNIKGWKKHLEMTMNLIVPVGMVRFVFFNYENQKHREEQIGATNYSLLTVPPGIWFGFQGISDSNSMILNLANMIHNSKEIDRKSIDEIQFNWTTNK